jgi:hypothetical protein
MRGDVYGEPIGDTNYPRCYCDYYWDNMRSFLVPSSDASNLIISLF